MWAVRVLALAVFLFVQLLVLADVLNQRDDDPAADVDWVAVFAPLIVYAALSFIYIIATLFRAGVLCVTQPPPPSSQTTYETGADDNNVRGNGAQRPLYGSADAVERTALRRKRARVLAWDGVIDLVVLALFISFVALTIDQLTRIDDDVPGNERTWSGSVLVPLFILFPLLFVLVGFAALRTAGEERYQRPLRNAELFSASCGDVVSCCSLDEQQLTEAARQRQDKRQQYSASANFHQLPCVFVCAPSMTFGGADFLIAWLLYLLLLAALGVLIALGARLDGTTDALLNTIFIVLYVFGGLLILGSVLLAVSLCCCYRGAAARAAASWPSGRYNVLGKYTEAVFVFVFSVLGIVQLLLIAERVDHPDSERDWQVVFVPAYLALTITLLVGCCALACRRVLHRPPPTERTAVSGSAYRVRSAAGAQPRARAAAGPSSDWGVFE